MTEMEAAREHSRAGRTRRAVNCLASGVDKAMHKLAEFGRLLSDLADRVAKGESEAVTLGRWARKAEERLGKLEKSAEERAESAA